MGSPLKYPYEELKYYLIDNPNATHEEMAQDFSGTTGGIKKALLRYEII